MYSKSIYNELFIRVDMNNIIATGHLMRCLSIADEARKQGINTIFISADDNCERITKERGYENIILNTKWDDLESEKEKISNLVRARGITKLLIDTYQITKSYLEELKKITKVIYIDDINLIDYPIDMIIAYMNYYKDFQFEKRFNNATLLLGPKYAPIRDVFRELPKKYINETIDKILILSGGTDQYNILSSLLDKINKSFNRVNITVVCGRYNTEYKKLKEKYNKDSNIILLESVNDIEKYMLEADLCISAGGTTLYELCACGIPTITYAMADNQWYNVKSFDKEGIMTYLGDIRQIDITEKIQDVINQYSYKKRCEVSLKMQKKVDGRGTERIINKIMKLD